MSDTIDALADEFWDVWMESSPLLATVYGDHRFDDRLGPVSRQDEAAVVSQLRSIADRAASVESVENSDALTRDILVATIESNLGLVESGLYTAPISPYLGVQSLVPQTLSRSAAQTPDQAEMLLTRVRAIPAWLTEVEERVREDLADGITPTHTNLDRVLAQIDASVGAPIEQDPMMQIGTPPDWDGEQAWRELLRHAVEEGVRPAFARHRDFLAEVAAPVARPDELAGLLHMSDGEARYELVVRSFTGLETSADEIHRIGIDEATGALRDEFASIGSKALGLDDPADVIARLRSDPELRYDNEEEMLEHARRTIDRAWEEVPPWFGIMPRNKCEVVPVPPGLAPSMPPAYYGVGAPDGSRPGRYYLNTYQPQTRTRFDAEAFAHHEAIPGHHFDRTLASELTDIPRFRNYAADIAHAEGWGLYAERLADEIGLYSSPIDRLGMVSSDAWRAIRLVVDTGIHLHGWTRQEAIDFFAAHAPITLETITVETDRYIGMPGQALAYKMGQREIFRLRKKARTELGERFTYPGFHDVVLGNGSVPLSVLGRLVDDWIATAT
ncbi:MAG: DUF885 domain-containing protein [Acidimicrobiia bacterium]|nr:DUF885 domain-containing protein [Acidimicrobiia bacterium]